MFNLKYNLLYLLLGLLYVSCEEVVDVKLDEGRKQLVVDAFVDSRPQAQQIRLTWTSAYFDNSGARPVTDAVVQIRRHDGAVFPFALADSVRGVYEWRPLAGESLGAVGDTFTLHVERPGEAYQSTTALRRVTAIDSVTYEYNEKKNFQKAGYTAAVYARDSAGEGDAFWIKVYRNGEYWNKPEGLIYGYDAAFGKGSPTDGLIFIKPLREAVNPSDKQYQEGDSVFVELHSVTGDGFDFLTIAREQMTNGGLFATPPANVPTNIRNATPGATQQNAVGWFNVAAVAGGGVRIRGK